MKALTSIGNEIGPVTNDSGPNLSFMKFGIFTFFLNSEPSYIKDKHIHTPDFAFSLDISI